MAQRQITELPTASTPDGSELLLVRQDIYDKKLDVSSLLAYLQSVLDDRYLNESLNLSDVDAVQTAFDNIKQVATDSYQGVVELSTVAEAIAGIDATRAVTPEGLLAAIQQNVPQATYSSAGKVELATPTEAYTGTDSTRAVTPEALKYTIDNREFSFQTALTSLYDGRYLNESSNLSDLTNFTTARSNLNVYSKSETDGKYAYKANNLSDLSNKATAFDNIKQQATVSYKGVVELATPTEAYTGTDSTRAVTPEALKYTIDNREFSFQTALTSLYDGRYLNESSNLSDLTNFTTARSNLNVYSKSETDGKYAYKANNLSDLSNKATAFDNIKQQATVSYKGVVELATSVETTDGTRNDLAVTPASLKAMIDDMFCGQVAAFAMGVAPDGWLKCNGQAVSRTTYSRLFSKIGTTFGSGNGSTTFNLPDLRGEFVRGFDDGRGADSQRILGSFQDASMENHYHGTGSFTATTNDDIKLILRNWSGSTYTTRQVYGDAGNSSKSSTSGGSSSVATATSTNFSEGSGETRPRNVALLYCIKY
jgi:microcystin-dependent protein